ncbi:MAG: hypothetical protein J5636_05765 [Clostridiales bacterium]|nr:hypothetical protein [Clostridiales bacterium]
MSLDEKIREKKVGEIKSRWNDKTKAYLRDVVKVSYSFGGVQRGFDTISVLRSDEGAKMEVIPNPYSDEYVSPRSISHEQWEQFLIDLFTKIRILDWKSNYVDSKVYGGTQWEVLIGISDELWYRHVGSNAFPKNYDEFKNLIFGLWRSGK